MTTDTEYMDIEQQGRNAVRLGITKGVRLQYSLSQARLGQLIGTTGPVIAAWEARPAMAATMHVSSAVSLGLFLLEVRDIAADLVSKDIKPIALMPLRQAAVEAGLSPHSPSVHGKCRTGELDCVMLGRLGLYIPRTQAGKLLRKATT